ncbi:unnamed protein product [Trichobilharzia regenti]|nr:unnamed protein product [Trichobilharzia regenti]
MFMVICNTRYYDVIVWTSSTAICSQSSLTNEIKITRSSYVW